jgi:hypothetical protein
MADSVAKWHFGQKPRLIFAALVDAVGTPSTPLV